MATAKPEQVNEDTLTCAICCNVYVKPCTLNCKHSFCRKCISTYLKSKPDAVKKQMIPCPSCRQMTKVPDPTKPVEEWAENIKLNLVVQGLMNTMEAGNVQEESSKSCSLCLKIGETTPCVMWCLECEVNLCDRCVKLHRHQPTTNAHDLCDLADKGKVKKKRNVMCKEHIDEQIRLYCKDCNKALCHSCAVVYHRKCESVVTIHSMMSKIKEDMSTLRRSITEEELRQRNLVERRKRAITNLQNDKHSLKEEIRSASQRAIELINLNEKQLIDQVDVVTDEQRTQLQADVKTGDINRQMYRQHGEYIDQSLNGDCEMDIYDLFQIWKSGYFDTKSDSDTEKRERQIDSFKFDNEKQNIQQILGDLNLGEIVVRYSVCDPISTPVLYNTTDGRTDGDEKEPDLHDITVLVVDDVQTIVATDRQNKCVKSFYTRNKCSRHSKLSLDKSPYGITQLKENQVMVAVRDSRQIVTIAVNPELQLLSTTTTDNRYDSLAVLESSSLAGCTDSHHVDILNTEGQVMRSVTTYNDVKVFKYPEYVDVSNKGSVLVSDLGLKSATCVSPNGDVVWTYAPTGDKALLQPSGITTTSGGQVLLADKYSNKVILLTESGQYVRDVLTAKNGIRWPLGIYADTHGSLFVCEQKKVKEFIFL